MSLKQGRGKLPPPDFTLKELRDVIPDHCFERNHWFGFAYILRDCVLLLIAGYIAHVCIQPEIVPSTFIRGCLWAVYAFISGSIATGLWVIAHECGHRAFSESIAVNDAVGLVLHSILLVPYHSWRISHSSHHKNTAHIKKDQVFVPVSLSDVQTARVTDALDESPIKSLISVIGMLLIGWPGYLFFNVSGQNYGRRTNHFEPSSPIFKPDQRTHVIVSDIALLVVLAGLYALAQATSWGTVAVYYIFPYLWVNFWLVSITFLQHTHQDIPHYADAEWNFVRGALCTIDRDVGIFNWLHHHIADTHVAHHLFSKMPFYHAEEATKALETKLGKQYRRSSENFFYAIYEVWRSCQYLDDSTGSVLYFVENNNGNKSD